MKKLLWGICLLLMTVCPGRVQAAAADFPSLNKEYICAWMSLASYSDRIGLAAGSSSCAMRKKSAPTQNFTMQGVPLPTAPRFTCSRWQVPSPKRTFAMT